MMRTLFAGAWLLVILGMAAPAAGQTTTALEEEVRATERAFAQSMADRDLAAFTAIWRMRQCSSGARCYAAARQS